MRLLLLTLLFTPAVAFAQPADRDVTITIPGVHLARIQAICEDERRGMEEPAPATLTLRRCIRIILFNELRQRNGVFTRRDAVRSKRVEIDAFNTGLVD